MTDPKSTAVTPRKPEPLSVSVVPPAAGPAGEEIEVTVGAAAGCPCTSITRFGALPAVRVTFVTPERPPGWTRSRSGSGRS